MKKASWYLAAALLICMALPLAGYADGPGDGAGAPFENTPPPVDDQDDPVLSIVSPPDPQDTPIDGGLLLLLAAGGAYGVKRYRNSRGKQRLTPGLS